MAKKKAEKEEEGQEGHGAAPADGPDFAHGEKQAKLIGLWKKHSDWTAKQIGEEFKKQTGSTVSAPTISKAKVKALGGNGSDEVATTAAVSRRPGRPPAGAHIEIGEGGAKETGDQVSLDAVRQVRQLVKAGKWGEGGVSSRYFTERLGLTSASKFLSGNSQQKSGSCGEGWTPLPLGDLLLVGRGSHSVPAVAQRQAAGAPSWASVTSEKAEAPEDNLRSFLSSSVEFHFTPPVSAAASCSQAGRGFRGRAA